jgi:uncharacterized protein YecE (DUF72 family)
VRGFAAMGVAVGTSSWTDPTLVKGSDWYPAKSMSAEERLRFYASVFTAVEVDATYYRPPSRQTAELWAERTPPGFRFDIKAFSVFTGHPAKPSTLWEDVAGALSEEKRQQRTVYAKDLPDEAMGQAWDHFLDALDPLVEAGKLGAVVFQFPPWFTPKRANRDLLASVAERLEDVPGAVELRNGRWFGEEETSRTLALLEGLGLAYVCVDGPQGFPNSVPPVVASTADFAMVRFHGRNRETWNAKGLTPAERFRYLYDEAELTEWVDPIHELARSSSETHALMNNCYQDYGVRNAYQLGTLLDEGLQPGAEERVG